MTEIMLDKAMAVRVDDTANNDIIRDETGATRINLNYYMIMDRCMSCIKSIGGTLQCNAVQCRLMSSGLHCIPEVALVLCTIS